MKYYNQWRQQQHALLKMMILWLWWWYSGKCDSWLKGTKRNCWGVSLALFSSCVRATCQVTLIHIWPATANWGFAMFFSNHLWLSSWSKKKKKEKESSIAVLPWGVVTAWHIHASSFFCLFTHSQCRCSKRYRFMLLSFFHPFFSERI